MIRITKSEMDYLYKVAKIKFGENGISRTYGHSHSYYLCESPKNLKILKKYYQSIGKDTIVVDKLLKGKGDVQ